MRNRFLFSATTKLGICLLLLFASNSYGQKIEVMKLHKREAQSANLKNQDRKFAQAMSSEDIRKKFGEEFHRDYGVVSSLDEGFLRNRILFSTVETLKRPSIEKLKLLKKLVSTKNDKSPLVKRGSPESGHGGTLLQHIQKRINSIQSAPLKSGG